MYFVCCCTTTNLLWKRTMVTESWISYKFFKKIPDWRRKLWNSFVICMEWSLNVDDQIFHYQIFLFLYYMYFFILFMMNLLSVSSRSFTHMIGFSEYCISHNFTNYLLFGMQIFIMFTFFIAWFSQYSWMELKPTSSNSSST